MTEQGPFTGEYKTYFIWPLTDGGQNDNATIQDNLDSLGLMVQRVIVDCPRIKPVIPQHHWQSLIGLLPYDTALEWCGRELQECRLALWPEKDLSGKGLQLTHGVQLEIAWAREIQEARQGEFGFFEGADAVERMAQWFRDVENGHKEV